MKSYKLSIITINYNNLKGLKKTFESIKAQTYQEFEWIIIDGGSTDGSKEFIEIHKDYINYWVSEKDSGLYNAMNKGIKVANGEYLNFMNSGDFFYENKTLEKVIPNLNREIIYGNTMLVFKDKQEVEKPVSKLSFNFLMDGGINHQATFFKKDLFYNSFLYNESYKISSDWEFLVYNLIIKNATYKKLDLIICYYDKYGVSSVPETLNIYLSEREEIKNKYFRFLMEQKNRYKNKLSIKRQNDVQIISNNKVLFRLFKWNLDLLLLFVKKSVKKL